MKITMTVFVLLLVLELPTKAQNSFPWDFKIKLRKSFQSEDSKPEAAMISYTKPKNRSESFLIDAALGLQLVGSPNLSANVFCEYHRNTLVEKSQNAIQSGVALEWYTNSEFNTDDAEENSHTTIINWTTKYSDDIIQKIESIQSTGELTILLTKANRKGCILPNVNNRIGTVFDFQYFPSVGYELENRIKCKNDSAKGNIFRMVGKIHASIFPIPQILKSSIEIYCDFAYRYDLINSTLYSDYSHPWIQTGANLVLFDDGKTSTKLSCSYNTGDNPAQGLKKQDYILVALKVKI